MKPHADKFDPDTVAELIRTRRTLKVLADPDVPLKIDASSQQANDAFVIHALKTAGWAPFHYDRGEDGLAEPWRAHVLWQPQCRTVAEQLPSWVGDASPGKLPAMFAACGAAVIVNWIPQFRHEQHPKAEQANTDDEHLAATAAMVQSFLLMLTARGMGSYWSSGGQMRSPLVFERLGIPQNQKLLAVVFVEYPETLSCPVERKPGKHRDRRSDDWFREVAF